MSDQITINPSPDGLAVAIVAETDPVAQAVRALQARVEDVGVRESRNRRWCEEFSHVMSAMFPNGPLDPEICRECTNMGYNGVAWRDSDGADCRGHIRRDAEGYDRQGFNEHGWNREGVNRAGERRDDPARYRFDRNGWDVDGFLMKHIGWDSGTPEQERRYYAYAPDADGILRNLDGYDWRGYHRDGHYNRDHNQDNWIMD